MRIFYSLICLFLSINALAQVDTTRADAIVKIHLGHDASTLGKNSKFLSIIDGVKYYRSSVKDLIKDTSKIIDIKILIGNNAKSYGKSGSNGVLIITTKEYAIKTYKAKLDAFSSKYHELLTLNHNVDTAFFYVINGEPVEGGRNDIIKKIYTAKNIKSVDCLPQNTEWLNNKTPIVIITTKE